MKYISNYKNVSGIYQIINIKNGKSYIGSAVSIVDRYRIHKSHLNNNKHHSQYLQRSYNKYGKDSFIFEVLEVVKDKNKLVEREQFYLDTKFFAQEFINNEDKCFRKLSYNICPTADSRLGVRHTQETKNKISKVQIGKIISKESIAKMVAKNTGRKRSKQARENISKGKRGVKFSEEHKIKMSENAKLRIGDKNPFYGKTHSEETKRKNSEAQKNMPKKKCVHCGKEASPSKIARWHNDHCLKNPNIDVEKEKESRKHSKETKIKMGNGISEARKREDVKLKHKLAIDKRPLLTCPHCGYQSRNKGSIVQQHFDNCRNNNA